MGKTRCILYELLSDSRPDASTRPEIIDLKRPQVAVLAHDIGNNTTRIKSICELNITCTNRVTPTTPDALSIKYGSKRTTYSPAQDPANS